MIAFIINRRKVGCSKDRFCPAKHSAHRTAVIFVGYFIIYRQIMLCIYNRLHIVSYFADIVTRHQLPAFRVRGGYLRLTTLFQLTLHILVIIFSALMLFYFFLYDLFIVLICFCQGCIVFSKPGIYVGQVPLDRKSVV